MELQGRYAELQQLGLGVASITYDPPALIKRFADERKIAFPILSDQDHTIVERYGILNRDYAPGHLNYGIPHPGTFILDRDGRVLARYFEEEFQYRNTTASIALKIGRAVRGLGEIRHTTRHADITAFLTDQNVAPGHRFSIVIDVAPKDGRRIVGPGQPAYRAVALRLEGGDNLLTYALAHPPTTRFAVAPDGTRLPAYAQPFRLVQDVAVTVNPEMSKRAQASGATVTLKGILEYQACTDGACDPPEQVPLSWTLGLKPLG